MLDERVVIVLATAEPFALRARQVVDALKAGEVQKLGPLLEEMQDQLPELVEAASELDELDEQSAA